MRYLQTDYIVAILLAAGVVTLACYLIHRAVNKDNDLGFMAINKKKL